MKQNNYKIHQSYYLQRLKKTLKDWVQLHNHEIAFTLTINQDLPKHIAEKIFKKFWNLAERKLQGNKRRRFGVGLERMVCLERGISLNPDSPEGWCIWHQHGTIKCPKRYSLAIWKLRIKLNLSDKVECLNPPFLVNVSDLGWSQYCSKQYTPDLEQLNVFATQLDYTKDEKRIGILTKI